MIQQKRETGKRARSKNGFTFEMFSHKFIKRKRKFYKRDKQGYYYIPEVSEEIGNFIPFITRT